MSDIIIEHKRLGFHLVLYTNRLEINAAGKKETIPLRNIASIEKAPLTNAITIKTNDGKRRQFHCGKDNQAVYEAILNAI